MPVYQDGPFPSGAPILTINSVPYKCNSFTVNKSSTTVPVLDENGAASGALSFADARTGTAEVQFANSAVAEPTTAAQNNVLGVLTNVNIDGANVNCFVTSCAINKPQRAPWTATLGWQARIN